jgi:mannose-6-phosphate isomerase
MASDVYPLLFTPVHKDYVWGGTRIAEIYHRQVSLPTCGESWEISDRPEGMSVVSNGPLAGWTLARLVAEKGSAILGTACRNTGTFPLLIKLIDARQNLSLQVHPDNESAVRAGGEAKTEMWIVLGTDKGAGVYLGLKPGTDQSAFLDALKNKRLPELFRWIPSVSGQAIFVPGGCVHAIGAGSILLEIQQNSNTTYRVYDWDRLGANGKPRELHLDKALEVIRWAAAPQAPLAPQPPERFGCNTCQPIHSCPYFRVVRWELNGAQTLDTGHRSFAALFIVSGTVRVVCGSVAVDLPPGTSCLVPAAAGPYELAPRERSASVILTELP